MKTHLVLDAGNTRVKAGVFTDDRPVISTVFDLREPAPVQHLARKYRPDRAILSAVTDADRLIAYCRELLPDLVILSHNLQLPFTNTYRTPETLGRDRMAGVAGAVALYPRRNCLIVDAGTCLTYDLLTADGTYRGGAIAPGLRMRLQAMSRFTNKLPLIEPAPINYTAGLDTTEAIRSGAVAGMTFEIEGYRNTFARTYDNLTLLLTGGDAAFFAGRLKKPFFAVPDLILNGLNKILTINA